MTRIHRVQVPIITTEKGQVYFQGDILTLEGRFRNDHGLKLIEIVNKKLGIDFKIDLSGEKEYELKFERKLPIISEPEILKLFIILTDIENEVSNFSFNVDYAFQPSISNMQFYQDPIEDNKP